MQSLSVTHTASARPRDADGHPEVRGILSVVKIRKSDGFVLKSSSHSGVDQTLLLHNRWSP
jgi:hypothetical protein